MARASGAQFREIRSSKIGSKKGRMSISRYARQCFSGSFLGKYGARFDLIRRVRRKLPRRELLEWEQGVHIGRIRSS